MKKKLFLIAFSLLTTCITSNSAVAALFDDEEARKKILEVEKNHNIDQAAIAKRFAAIEAILHGGVLGDMQSQIEALKQEIAQLKGDLELTQHQLENTQNRQKELYTDTDTRLRKVESKEISASNSNQENAVTNDQAAFDAADTKAFAEADKLNQTAKYKEAFVAFDNFLKDHANSKLVPDALYGMAYSQFALKNYKSSIVTQQKLIDLHPRSEKVPDALYNQANSHIQLSQISSAKKILRELVEKYPDAAITQSAKKRLKVLEGFK